MLTIAEANELIDLHLGRSSRATHSRFVGHAMRAIAGLLGEDVVLWEITGLCHDLDYNATQPDWARHGLLAGEWLDGRLSAPALDAIRSHDHRTGVRCDTAICHALKLADALAIACDLLADEAIPVLRSADSSGRLVRALAAKPYLPSLIVGNASSLGLSLGQLADVLAAAPPPS